MGPLLGLAKAFCGPALARSGTLTRLQTWVRPLPTRLYHLDGCNQDVLAIAQCLSKEGSNVVVMTGAGVSTPSGIPDFRTPGSGIYDNLKQYRLPYPEAIFDISYFRQSPDAFNTWAKEFFPGLRYHPNLAHFFIKLLHDKGKLVRLYTQNIDGLEVLTGLPHEQVVHAHGSFNSASCAACGQDADLDEYKQSILLNQNPRCACSEKAPIKPDIVFFGENLPDRFQMFQEDTAFSDFLICMGTSLEVYPFAGIADAVPRKVPRLLINRTLVGSFGSREEDCLLLGDLVEQVIQLCRALGWEQDLFDLKNAYDKEKQAGQ
ncbi:NAD-dependent protein deacetylase sirtuin-3-like [Tigriopus californicus]|uniref:NAD-dependent protein deacetylase sirtuin-3-like n=1 Tax=Tigriopus californicus TaxID=6832 RepID=UPI0027DA20F2|nr:NAD-dependent protein deacetylase sirtuin-3-like [Tigriopus californicus]|eukprot:TCALIF_08043-PA protein Name:"Similar to Sirt3 NAD-dependent protein deacetylase sirtuin-3 (Mus musculus)" AED:0.22 eAED:0.22 QI:0/-1/0/1/-1/1/1/0/318